jgi:hypothetical protein
MAMHAMWRRDESRLYGLVSLDFPLLHFFIGGFNNFHSLQLIVFLKDSSRYKNQLLLVL